ncbi:MAG: response regulator [Pseudomonadota bacterium]
MQTPAAEEADKGELILVEDDPADLFAMSADDSAPWRILIVDDDVDVHVVTKFALSNTNFQGRRLSFLHAYSGQEAIALLRSTPDIALVLLDVIMETADAGLRVARQVREELHNELVRIVLRTGQPGQALEHSIIVDYDINDFWCKADLTTRKLFTTVIASLRSFAALSAAAAERAALSAALARAHNVQAAVNQHALVLTLDRQARVVDANQRLCDLAGISREAMLGQPAIKLASAPIDAALLADIAGALARDGGWAGDVPVTGNAGKRLTLRFSSRRRCQCVCGAN